MNIAEKVEELEKIAGYCSDEYFDYLTALCNLHYYHREMMTPLLVATLEDTISTEYDNVKQNTRLVEETETITRKVITVEWTN